MAAVSPALKDLPKVSDDLKTQLEAFNHEQMKHADTQEKVILPSAEGMLVLIYRDISFFFVLSVSFFCFCFLLFRGFAKQST